MINSTYVAKRFEDLNSDACMLNAQSATATIAAGSTTNVDLQLTDDHFITGLEAVANNSNFGDTVTMQIVDNDNVLPTAYGAYWTTEQPILYPTYPILRQFATNWAINSDTQLKFAQTALYPAKVIAGLTVRAIYTSTGTTNVNVAMNYELHKILF
jgi:hypothetical protein